MSLKTKLYELAKDDSDLMVAIEDVKTFHGMTVDNKLRVTDPIAYRNQHNNLNSIRESYSKVIAVAIADNFDLMEFVLGETLNAISSNGIRTIHGTVNCDPISWG